VAPAEAGGINQHSSVMGMFSVMGMSPRALAFPPAPAATHLVSEGAVGLQCKPVDLVGYHLATLVECLRDIEVPWNTAQLGRQGSRRGAEEREERER
jgi:hypothetical protein